MGRFKALAINIGLAVFAVIIILSALEAALAITKFNTTSISRFIPGKGTTYIPHAYYRHTKEGFSEDDSTPTAFVITNGPMRSRSVSLGFLKRFFEALKTRSHLLSLISERIYLLRRQFVEARLAEAHAGGESVGDKRSKSLDLFSDLNIYRNDLAPPWKEAIEITKEILLAFKKSVEEHGSRFLVLGLSNAEQIHTEVGSEKKNQYNVEFDCEQPDRILEEFANEHGVTFLKLLPAFRDYHIKTGDYLHGFGSSHEGHWNQAGHRLAAELLFQFLKEQHMVPLESKAL
jgi:hypothetical protein